uniref:Uncharacterized protein n=1 Tax=Chromera velia CCMP2878 TaxID=1169474 RepID=A0A0G4I997_9ALVE|eukprot:Cvel_2034.t1-p1 / transcript=Cvel_2034.t1 / gene=Cvel_2034 / organism=Chromera_velia_CCMP2878 / gene_product=hypothetical protein / transcript_product=hypothetical protein / location=Cvel_scaffold78:21516-22736(-) / protein_length=169 / sequence_SO=supercontig / SO=protein_coding / is_pseudo=false
MQDWWSSVVVDPEALKCVARELTRECLAAMSSIGEGIGWQTNVDFVRNGMEKTSKKEFLSEIDDAAPTVVPGVHAGPALSTLMAAAGAVKKDKKITEVTNEDEDETIGIRAGEAAAAAAGKAKLTVGGKIAGKGKAAAALSASSRQAGGKKVNKSRLVKGFVDAEAEDE